MPLLDLMKGLVPAVSSSTLRTGGSKRRMKRRRSERLSVNCMKNDAVIDMKGAEGPECWSSENGSFDLSIFFMLNQGDSGHDNDDGSISTAPTDDYTSQDSIHMDDITLDRRKEEAVYLEFDPHVSRDLGIGDFKSLDLRQTSMSNTKTSRSKLTEQDFEWSKKKSGNPYNDYLARKYDRERIERALNLFCPPDEDDEIMDDSCSIFLKKESSFKTVNSKVLEEFSIEAYGGSRPNSARTAEDDDVSSLKLLFQSSKHLVRSKVQMPQLPSVVNFMRKSEINVDVRGMSVMKSPSVQSLVRSKVQMPQLPSVADFIRKSKMNDDIRGMGVMKSPSAQVSHPRPTYGTIIQESQSNLTVSSPTGLDDFERWNESNQRSDKLILEVKQKAQKDPSVDDSMKKLSRIHQEPIKNDSSERRVVQQERDDSNITNIAELRYRMRTIAAEYGSPSRAEERRGHNNEGQSINTEASSILELKSHLRLLESSFRHYQKALLCS